MSAINTIVVTLQTRAEIEPGSMLLISGLVGALTNDTNAMQLGGDAAGRSIFGTSAVWRQQRGELVLVAQDTGSNMTANAFSHAVAFDRKGPFVVNFTLQNPPHGQEPGSISIQSLTFDAQLLNTSTWSTSHPDLKAGSGVAITRTAMAVAGSHNSAPMRVAFIMLALIGQTTTSGTRPNTITVTMRANVDIDFGSVVLLSGLHNSGTASNKELPIACFMKRPGMSKALRVVDFGYTALWDRDNGTLALQVWTSKTYALADYTISFELINPDRGQESPNIYISILNPSLSAPAVLPTLVQKAAGDESPLFVLDFLIKHIAQSTPSVLASNTISVSLIFRTGVQAGSLLIISGLTGSLTPDTHDLALGVQVSETYLQNSSIAQSVRAWNTSSAWTQADGSLAIVIQGYVLPDVPYELQFTLQNPAAGQKPPLVAIELSGASSIPKTEMQTAGGNGAALGVALFLANMWKNVSISQSSPYPRSLNTITVTIGLESRIYDMQSRITLSGLSGTDTSPGPIAIQHINNDNSSNVSAVQFRAHWTIAADTDRLVLSFNSSLEPFSPYILSFQVRNQAAMQASPAISIELSGSIAVLRRQIRGATGNAAPLLIGGFSIKNISHTSTTPGAINTILVSLATNIEWTSSFVRARTIVISLQGLSGTQTSGDVLNVSEISSTHMLAATAFWTQASGQLEVRVLQNASLDPGQVMSFSFQLVNPPRAHTSGVIVVSAAATDGEGPNVTLASQADMTRAAGHRAPLLVAGLLTGSIDQSSVAQSESTCLASVALSPSFCSRSSQRACEACSVNTMSLRFATNVQIIPPARITLQGLVGSLDVGLPALGLRAQGTNPSPALSGNHVSSKAPQDVGEAAIIEWDQSILSNASAAIDVFGVEAAAWNASRGILVIDVKQAMQPWALYQIQFDLLNPHRARDPVNASFSLTSTHHHIPQRQLVGGSGNKAPLLVTGFTVKNISQLDPSPSRYNTITVMLAAHSLLPAGDEIVITGLIGADTRSTQELRIHTAWTQPPSSSTTPASTTSSPPTTPVPTSTTTTPEPSTATTTPAPNSSSTTTPVPMSSNPNSSFTTTPVPSLSSTTCTAAPGNSLFGVSVCNQTGAWFQDTGQLRLKLSHDLAAHTVATFSFTLLNPERGQDAPRVSIQCVGRARIAASEMVSAPGNHAPLLVADFLAASISQETPGALASNVLRLVVALRAALPVGTVLHITGLTGSESPDGFIDLEGNMTRYTTRRGVWQQAPGRLNITCALSVPPETLLVLHVPLLNGRHPQESPRIFIESSGPVNIAAAPMSKAAANESPLKIAGLVARMHQSSSQRSATNNLTIDFISNVRIPNNSTVAVHNLLGAAPSSLSASQQLYPPALLLHVMPVQVQLGTVESGGEDNLAQIEHTGVNSTRISATWPGNQQVHMHIPQALEAQQHYRLIFQVRNPTTAQASPHVSIQVLGPIAVFEAPVLKPPSEPISSALRAPLAVVAELLHASIRQTTPNPGAVNMLRVSFTSRDNMLAADRVNITVAGLLGAASPIGTEMDIELDHGRRNLLAHVGRWDRHAGQLVVEVTGDISAGNATNFSFNVTNPFMGQDGQNITLESSGLIHLRTPVTSAAKNDAPLLVGHIREASLKQSNPFYGASNLLHLSFSSNVWLPNATLLSVTGFPNTSAIVSSGSSHALTVVQADSMLSSGEIWAPGQAIWDSRAGLILVSLTADLVANTKYGITIQIENPLAARQAVVTSHLSAEGPVELSVYNVSVEKGNMAPLFATGWQIKSIRQSTIATSAINTITISLQMPAQIFAGSKLIISGLIGSATPSGVLEVDAKPHEVWLKSATWSQFSGRLAFQLTADSEASRIYTLTVSLENSASGQMSPSSILLQTQDSFSREVVPRTAMTVPGGIHSPLVIAGFKQKTIWQSSRACNATNLLSVTLVGLVPLDARYHTIVTIRGLANSTTSGYNRKVPITARPPVMGSYARWFQASGALVLNLAQDSEGLQAHEMLSVDFELGNAALDRSVSRNVRVEVTWRDEHGKMVVIDPTPLGLLASDDTNPTCAFF